MSSSPQPHRITRWLARQHTILLAALAIALLLAPWPTGPEPHLVKQWGGLRAGALTRPLDMFDVVMHAAPTLLLMLHLGARWRARQRASAPAHCGE